MKFPLILRKTHDKELDKSISIITEKNRIIAIKSDEIKIEQQLREKLQYENMVCYESIDILENKVKKLEDYINKLEKIFNDKTMIACSLNTKLIASESRCKELSDANKKLTKLFNDANRKNWCNNESSRQLKLLAEDILEADKINKAHLSSYIHNIALYVGGGIPAEIELVDNIKN